MAPLSTLPEWIALEHDVQRILTAQELHGWAFDQSAAWQLASALSGELRETEALLRRRHPFVRGSEFTPKRNNRRQGYVEGAPFTRLKELNCSSRDHISWILQTFHGWKPQANDTYWEAYHRRSDSEGDWDRSCDDVPPDFDDNEDVGNDQRRRERLAEVEYDC